MVVLAVEGEEVSNPDLTKRHGVVLDKKSRLKLNDLKLIESRKQGRALVHVLTDAGWARVSEEIESPIPTPRGAAGAMSLALLSLLRGFLARSGQRFTDLFLSTGASATGDPVLSTGDPATGDTATGDTAALAPETEAVLSPESEPGDVTASLEGEPGDVTARIRAAYAELAVEPGAWVSLARLRPLLGGFARAEVDSALKGMIHLPEVSIVPENNQKALTPEARAAAVVIGDQDKHLISIEAR
ncbi:hypothetical protein [Streptosporangium carneum]|uniref:hypothetical protein n=1 Tax=Streptosporangium carneum TaxID=47481 RepID=UPI0022F2F93E|nr:hypothetical protein [Streptosporangium carneum]